MRLFLFLLLSISTHLLTAQCAQVTLINTSCESNEGWFAVIDISENNAGDLLLEGESGVFLVLNMNGEMTFGPYSLDIDLVELNFSQRDNPDCNFTLDVVRPENCGTDPCFGFALEINGISDPADCEYFYRATITPEDGFDDTTIYLRQGDDTVAVNPSLLLSNADWTPGDYELLVTNGACTLVEAFTITASPECGSISVFSWLDENENGSIDAGENGLRVTGTYFSESTGVSKSFGSDENGDIEIDALPPGVYSLSFNSPGNFRPTVFQADGTTAGGSSLRENLTLDAIEITGTERIEIYDVGWIELQCEVVAIVINDVTCFGDFDGEATVESTVGSGPFTYLWESGQTTATAIELPAGIFNVSVTDADGCVAIGTVEITEPDPITIGGEVIDVDCNGDATGEIQLFTNIIPTQILWSHGDVGNPVVGLTAGIYSVTVTDENGCEEVANFTVYQPATLIVDVSQNLDCGAAQQFDVSVSGGAAPYAHEWIRDDVILCQAVGCERYPPGEVYLLRVTDANGCVGEATGVVVNDVQILDNLPDYRLPCDGGAFTVTVQDLGLNIPGDFNFEWRNVDGVLGTGPSILISEPGEYTLKGVTTFGECEVIGTFEVFQASPLDVYALEFSTDPDCAESACAQLAGPTSAPGMNYFWELPTGDNVTTSVDTFLCDYGPGLYSVKINNGCDSVTLTAFLDPEPGCTSISGTVSFDADEDCDEDAGDLPVPEMLVEISSQDGTDVYYAITNSEGFYVADVLAGRYFVRPVPDPLVALDACEPLEVEAVVEVPAIANPLVREVEPCPLLTTEVSTPFLRRCFLACSFVEYANEGTGVAEDARLVVTFDEYLIEITSTTPFVRSGQIFTFELGDLEPGESGRIYFNYLVSCDAELGQAHCITSKITPDKPCVESDDWGGALVSVGTGNCDGSQVRFEIGNRGNNPMSVPLRYVIVEDGIMMTPDTMIVRELMAGEVFELEIPANGLTYQVITNQEPNAPASTEPSGVVEGCVTGGGTFSTGFVNQLPIGNGLPSESVVCVENVGSWDPNDKRGFPLGFGAENNIEPGTRLRYSIRFQNTGTDTAFNVVISDTIGAALDLATIKMEGASHDYEVFIDSQRVLTFRFADIMLPDSNVNLAASQGVINFTIDHAAGLERGDYITNQAAIYFDFNEPVITNVSSHRIAVEGLPTTAVYDPRRVAVGVFPNPTGGQLNVRIPAGDLRPGDRLRVTDLYGRALLDQIADDLTTPLDVRNLKTGYYLLLVTDASGRVKGRTGFVFSGK